MDLFQSTAGSNRRGTRVKELAILAISLRLLPKVQAERWPYLRFGFAADLQLSDSQSDKPSRLVAAAPGHAVTARVQDLFELAEVLDHGDGGLVDLEHADSLTHACEVGRNKKLIRREKTNGRGLLKLAAEKDCVAEGRLLASERSLLRTKAA